MKRVAAFWISIGIACAVGFGCADLALRSVALRGEIGGFFGRGPLLALVDASGVYQIDLNRQIAERSYVEGNDGAEPTPVEKKTALDELVANTAAHSRASRERISRSELTSQLDLLRFQFSDEKAWRTALNKSGLSRTSVARILSYNLRTRAWLSRRIASELPVTNDECRQFYGAHLEQFFLPERRNVSHLFLAAPPETPPEVVETKRAAIEALAARLASGEDFAALAAQNSEDDASKLRGGELGYSSAKRMPPDFVEAATRLRPGEISKPMRTRLGFHILKLIDVQPPRQQTFDEVRGDIAIELANQKCDMAIQKLIVDLRQDAGYLRPF
jgi:parvulin-like peptidyl-prolyl isomerase